jgi:peptide/nickel transport system permease protein
MAIGTEDPTLGPAPKAADGTFVAALPPSGRRARMREITRALLRSKTFMLGAIILLFWIVDAVVWGFSGSLWHMAWPYDPQAPDAINILKGPSGAHWFGTDDFGRDVFSRVLAGATSVLTVAAAATALGLLGGITIGLVAGYYRGIVDDVLMRLVDALLSFPSVIIAVLVLTVLGSSERNVILVIGIVFSPIVARTVRAAVLVEREREYVAAARLLGASGPFIMAREILPNITGPIVVEATVRLGYAIFTAATISFLGFGLQQPSPDWGLTISLGRNLLQVGWWIVLFPAAALATLVIALNFVADGLKEALAS